MTDPSPELAESTLAVTVAPTRAARAVRPLSVPGAEPDPHLPPPGHSRPGSRPGSACDGPALGHGPTTISTARVVRGEDTMTVDVPLRIGGAQAWAGEQRVAETFAALTRALVSDHDVFDLAAMLVGRAVELLEVPAAAVLLTDACTDTPVGPRGMTVAAASAPGVRRLETFGVELASGPGVDCVRTGRPVSVAELAGEPGRLRWPRFATAAGDAGIRSVHAVPLRARDQTVGALTLLHTDPHLLDDHRRRLGQALAEMTTVGLLHRRADRDVDTANDELRRARAREDRARHLPAALHSRDVIGQAKGILICHYAIGADDAFALLVRVSQHTNTKLHTIAAVFVDRVRAHGPAPARQCRTVTGVLDDLLTGTDQDREQAGR